MNHIIEIHDKILKNITKDKYDDYYNYLKDYYENMETEQEKSKISKTIYNSFISENTIYFNKTSKIFFNYIDNHYTVFNEDNLIYSISEYINNHKQYKHTIDINLKKNIKSKIIKTIKENNIYENIPDSDTIQMINNYLQTSIFNKKEYVKIFLIIIGNFIMKKNNKDLIFTRSIIKSFLSDINKYSSMYFCNNNIFNQFKFKYTSDHILNEKIILPCNDINTEIFNFNEQFYINLICVGIYYANRYNTILNYIKNESCKEDIFETIYYFKQDKKNVILNQFLDQYIIKKEKQTISEKELIFLWKKYIQEKDIFINIFTSYNDFIKYLFHSLDTNYDTNVSNNILHGYYSLETPSIEIFKSFWNEHFEYCETEYYFELNEILFLFKTYNKNKKIYINENIISNLIQIYYSHYNIIDNKMIHNLKCKLWDKKKEINDFISKNAININDNINHIYKLYSKSSQNITISKKYFKFYIHELIE